MLCLLAVVAAGAVNLAHVPDFAVKDRSPFASAVLAELNGHLSAGGPADQLQQIVRDIRARVTAAGEGDDSGWLDRETTCGIEIQKLQDQIEEQQKLLSENQGKQKTEEALIKEMLAAEQKFATARDGFNAEAEQIQKDLDEAQRKRDFEAEVFVNRTKDTNECIDAVNEILALDGNGILKKNQGRNRDTIEQKYDYERGSTEYNTVAISNQTLLASLQSKVSTQSARALIADTLDADPKNYDDLEELLGVLNRELEKYGKELARVETEAIGNHATAKEDGETAKEGKEEEAATAENNRKTSEETRIGAQGRLATLQTEEIAINTEITDLGTAKSTWQRTCASQLKEYRTRGNERAEELKTLKEIERLLQEKLGHLMDGADATATESDVRTRVDNVA